MRRRLVPWLTAALLAGLVPGLPALTAGAAGTPLRAGAAVLDATWHVGASQGQYAGEGPGVHDLDTGATDLHAHALLSNPTDGIESRDTVRALVMDDGDGGRWALVTNDLYIPQDLLAQRVATLLAAAGAGIDADHLTVSVSHSHSSPFYSSTTWGAWAFQDVFDIRFFEFMATRMADAVIAASKAMRPARAAFAQVPVANTKRNPEGPGVSEEPQPMPAGWMSDQTDGLLTLLRVDEAATRKPIANWVVYGRHPEGMKDNGLHTGEFVGALLRTLDRELGGISLFSQNDTGASEIAKDAKAQPGKAREEYDANSHNMLERVARTLADTVHGGDADIDAAYARRRATHGQVVLVGTDAPVQVATKRFAPPSYRAFSSVSNCKTERALSGDPGIPVVGLPDCTYVLPEELREASPIAPGVTYDTLREAGVPVPNSYGFPGYIALQESTHVVLQAIKVGRVAVTVCPCEMFTDQARNIRSRLDTTPGNQWFGFDWTASARFSPSFQPGVAYIGDLLPGAKLGKGVRRGPAQLDIDPKTPGDQWWCEPDSRARPKTWTCKDPRVLGGGVDQQLPTWSKWPKLAPVSHAHFVRWKARMYNDARGWDAYIGGPQAIDAVEAESEPVDPARIWGNWTHEEIGGYDMVVTMSMANDYWGYIPTYREWQARDFYRKALAGLGPHSSDFFATRLTRLAGELNGGAAVELNPKDLLYSPEESVQNVKATAIGNLAEAYLPVYEAALPPDGGTAGSVVQQPSSTKRFGFSQLRWVGGSNYTDTPHARVERLDRGTWKPFGNGYGEVQVKLAMPTPEDLPLVALGQFPYVWTATFEAYDSDIDRTFADGVRRSQVPTGTYRFVVTGCARGLVPDGSPDARCSEWDATGRVQPYAVTSRPFQVLPWDGITVGAPVVAKDGRSVSVDVGPDFGRPLSISNTDRTSYTTRTGQLGSARMTYTIGRYDYRVRDGIDYPDTMKQHPFSSYLTGRAGNDHRTYPGTTELFCFRCAFEPWAETGAVDRVTVTVTRSGVRQRVPASFDPRSRRWVAKVDLRRGDRVQVARGDVRDAFGEGNGKASPVTVASVAAPAGLPRAG